SAPTAALPARRWRAPRPRAPAPRQPPPPRARSGPGRGGRRSQVHRDVLDLEVLVDALGAALAAEPGLLDAAERRRRVGDETLVEAHHPRLQRLDDAERALDVAGVDVGDEPVLGVVRG